MSPVNDGVPVRIDDARAVDAGNNAISLNLTAFDTRYYLDLIRVRAATIRRMVRALKPVLGLRNALDAGCGVGFFAQTLTELGLETRGFDGRFENVVEARKRFPQIAFEHGDIESAEIAALGTFDLVLCFGLLYHLENPMRAIRHLRALAGTGLLIESMCVPGNDARMILREEPSQIDQSLTDMAFYPSEPCLVKMLYRAGFAHVYRVPRLPEHDHFRETGDHARRRTILLASHKPARVGCLERVAEPPQGRDPWTKLSVNPRKVTSRLRLFFSKSLRMQYVALANHARRLVRRCLMSDLKNSAKWGSKCRARRSKCSSAAARNDPFVPRARVRGRLDGKKLPKFWVTSRAGRYPIG